MIIRGGADSSPSAAAHLAALLDETGLKARSDASGCRVEVELSDAGDRGLLTVHAVASRFGWEVWDPQLRWRRRDAGRLPADLDFDMPSGPSRRAARWVANSGLSGAVRSLSVAADGTCAIACEAPRGAPDADCEVQVRSGADLNTVVARHRSLRAPIAFSHDGRRLAAAETALPHLDRTSISPGLRIITLGQDGDGVHWPLNDLFGWLAADDGRPAALAALTRHPNGRPPLTRPATAAAPALLSLEQDADARVVVADIAAEQVTALARNRELRETIFRFATLAVTGDGRRVIVASHARALGFSTATGDVIWSQPSPGDDHEFDQEWRAAAASRCGRLVALAGSDAQAEVNLVVLDTETGHVRLALNNRGFGSAKPPRAVCFHPSGWLAVGFGDGSVAHVSATGSAVRYRAMPRMVSALAFTADGATLLAGGSDTRGLRAIELTPEERYPTQV
ncbi:hypothetical protein ABGB18_38630 [Nonomuraea sp. B12E4]|uniref:WD40 repeat domain-containing protein n=1 Tax=Nonomuraea sp. B12E4 TaxID=3153564 RepID=UPI00325D4A1E